MIKKNHTYKITTEEKKDLIVTPIEHTPKVVETVEQNEVPLENQATQNIVECTEERINEISQATGKDPLQVEYELKEKAYKDYQKEHERITQRLRIEKDRGSWIRKVDRWSKRGGRLRREIFVKRQYYYLVAPYTISILYFHSNSSTYVISIKFYIFQLIGISKIYRMG